MSIKLFFQSTFGGIRPTTKIEAEHTSLLADYNEFCRVEQSDELKQFIKLEAFVNSDGFAQKKKEIENLKFKGSEEESQLKEFAKLSKHKKLQKFFATEKSPELERFNKINESEELKKYFELKKFVEEGAYQDAKKKSDAEIFKGSNEQQQLNEFKALEKHKGIVAFFKLNASKELKENESFSTSETLKRLNELEEKAKKNALLNEKKELKKLKQSSAIKVYFKFLKSKKYKTYQEIDGSQILQKHDQLKQEKEKSKEEEKELKQLQKNKKLQIFFRVKNSKELKDFLTFSSSSDLIRFQELEKKVGSGSYVNEQAELKRLKGQSDVKTYFKFINSSAYKLYLETKDSKTLERYNELKKLTESEEFLHRKAHLEDKKKFEKTDAQKKYQEFMQLKASDNIRFYFRYEKSPIRKNFLQMKDSQEKSRFLELKELCGSKEFLERKAYLEDNKKWEKTEEYQKQQSYLQQKDLPHIVLYFKYKDSNKLDFFKNWKLVFEDTFEAKTLDTEKWQTISLAAEKTLGKNYSQSGDLQAYTSGKNIKTGGSLKIETRKEKTGGMEWQMPFGFHEKEFDYSSGTINTGKSLNTKYGIFEAKVKYAPNNRMVSAIYLLGNSVSPQINLIETGIKNRMGMFLVASNKPEESTVDLNGLKANNFYIFRLEWSRDKLSWSVNGKTMHTLTGNVPDFEMHLNAATIVVKDTTAVAHHFEIDWIRVYQSKKLAMDINWADGFNGAITVCDRKGIVVYMNDFSKQQFVKYGGDNLIGESLIDCHPEPSRTKLLEMLKKPIENSYTTEKNGIKKMIHQSPWMENSEFKGIVEISFEIPNPTPNHLKE